jgi:TetR/AcrR family transcriptional regulator, cholesterol catabolism regulator
MKTKSLYIVEKVRRLYQRYGIKSVTMDDVAKHLYISKKTLYENFKDKEDLVTQVILLEDEEKNKFYREIENQGLNAIEELFQYYQMLFGNFKNFNPSMEYDLRKYYPDLYMKIRDMRRNRHYKSSYRNMIKGKKEGLYRQELNARIIAKLQVLRNEHLYETDYFTKDELSSFKAFHEMFLYHIQGIMSQNGRKFFEDNFSKFRSYLN